MIQYHKTYYIMLSLLPTVWFTYYATSKWGRKPLTGMKWAKASFWIMERAVILVFFSPISGFGITKQNQLKKSQKNMNCCIKILREWI